MSGLDPTRAVGRSERQEGEMLTLRYLLKEKSKP